MTVWIRQGLFKALKTGKKWLKIKFNIKLMKLEMQMISLIQ